MLREIDRRVRFLANRLEDITVVNNIPQNTQIVLFGAWVTLIDEDDTKLKVRIVGPDEIDAKNNYISMDSPLAKALFKKSVDDEASLTKPDGSVIYYEIVEIKYEKYS